MGYRLYLYPAGYSYRGLCVVEVVFGSDLQVAVPLPVVLREYATVPPRVVFPVWVVFYTARRVLRPVVFEVRSAVFSPLGQWVVDCFSEKRQQPYKWAGRYEWSYCYREIA